MSSKQTVIGFLDRHRSTYLAGLDKVFDLEGAFQHVRDAPTPTRADHFLAPHLKSATLSVFGPGRSHLADDLTERICAGHQTLRRAGARNARGRISAALNRNKLRVRTLGEQARNGVPMRSTNASSSTTHD